jgi:2'-5' RNA ligase
MMRQIGGRFMRLFTAILFDDEIKDALYDAVERLHQNSVSGSFTMKENLHLTVNFIGETQRVEEVKQAMKLAADKVRAECFALSIGGLGKFKRNEGDIYWIGVEKDTMLWRIQREMGKELREAGFFDVDDKEYRPHLTLGRRVKVQKDFDVKEFDASIHPMKMNVDRISLMKSERVQGKLVYTEIYHVKMEKQ